MNAVHNAVHANAVTCAVSAAVVCRPNVRSVSSHSPSRYERRCRAHASRSTSPRGCRTRRAGSRPSSTRARSPSCTRPVAAPPRTRLGCGSTRTTLPPGARPIVATQSVSQSVWRTGPLRHTLRTIGSGADTRHTVTGRITGSGDCWTHRSRRAATTPRDVRTENSPQARPLPDLGRPRRHRRHGLWRRRRA